MSRIDRLEVFHRKDPENAALACELVEALLTAGRIGRARELLASLSPQVREDPRLRFCAARCALLDGRLPRAAELLQPLKDTAADGPLLRHDLAFIQFSMGDVDTALKTLEPVLANPESSAAIDVLHARLLHWRGEYDAALRAIDQALAKSLEDADALGVQALLLLDSGDRDGARRAAEAAVARSASQIDAETVLGTLALWEQRPDEAENYFSSILSRQPGAGRALLGLGQVRMLHGQWGLAREALERAVANMPHHIGSWHALAWCQLLLGELEAAQSSYEHALAIDRSFGETHGGMAILHALRGENLEAEEEIKRARKLDPSGRSAVYARALLYLASGRDDLARRLIAPLVAGTPGEGDPLHVLKELRARMLGR
jgi:tetratricopeptide (TPR) repeat protein